MQNSGAGVRVGALTLRRASGMGSIYLWGRAQGRPTRQDEPVPGDRCHEGSGVGSSRTVYWEGNQRPGAGPVRCELVGPSQPGAGREVRS